MGGRQEGREGVPSVETACRGGMPRRRAQSGEPVCAEAKGKPIGAQLLSEAERRRGAAFGCQAEFVGEDMLSVAPSAPRPQSGK